MNANGSLKILIVDDHAVVREGLEAMLGIDPHFGTITTAGSAEEALHLCSKTQPDVVLLDLRMPQMDGFCALKAIHARWPEIRVLVLSAAASTAEIKLARYHGASGFVSKTADRSSLIRAILSVAAGGSAYPSDLSPSSVPPSLSAREMEVLRHLGRGLSSQELGVVLGISPETVRTHIKSIFQKLSVTSRAEAVSRAFETGLLAVDS
jgi:DNA-binding NarL/FixJ family response regulator